MIVPALICGVIFWVAMSNNKDNADVETSTPEAPKELPALDKLAADSKVPFFLMIPSEWEFNIIDEAPSNYELQINCLNSNISMSAYEYNIGFELDLSIDAMPEWFKNDENPQNAKYWFDMTFYTTKEDFDFDDGAKGYCLKNENSTLFMNVKNNWGYLLNVFHGDDSEWYHENEELIYKIARTLSK